MKIIISPAKKMNIVNDFLEPKGLPVFLEETQALTNYIQSLSYQEAKSMWKCNDQLAALNYQRFEKMDITRATTPALLSYEGLQYQYMAPDLLGYEELDYLQEHLRILSGFYGVLKPMDAVLPYRLEMQAKVALSDGTKSLYKFWGQKLYDELGENELIVNLASKEYFKAIEPFVEEKVQFVTIIFNSYDKAGKLKVKATEAKIARGEMVRFMAEKRIESLEELKKFTGRNFRFQQDLSDDLTMIFVQK